MLKKQGRRNQARGAVPTASATREVVQVDTVHFGSVFAFTAVDIFSREADVLLRGTLTADDGVLFLRACMKRRFDGHVQLLQSDGGPEFKGEFALRALVFCDRHRIARPYKKKEQSYIESFNRKLQPKASTTRCAKNVWDGTIISRCRFPFYSSVSRTSCTATTITVRILLSAL